MQKGPEGEIKEVDVNMQRTLRVEVRTGQAGETGLVLNTVRGLKWEAK